MTATSEWHY